MIGTTTMRRGLALVAATAILAMPIGLAPANAEPDYPPSFYQITATSFTAKVGSSVKFTAQTFARGSSVAVDVSAGGSSVGQQEATANNKGIATTSVTFTTAGVNTVTMSGTSDKGDPLSLSADVTVSKAGSGGQVDPVDNGSGGAGGGNDPAASADAAGGVPFLGGGLPRTGGQIAATAVIAAALLGLGILLVTFTRRRRSS